ncbi:hypothetical protein P8452_35469 [Trifolium repens]|nr:hypothetical protein P8452_35469 [Trifolium repens]
MREVQKLTLQECGEQNGGESAGMIMILILQKCGGQSAGMIMIVLDFFVNHLCFQNVFLLNNLRNTPEKKENKSCT